MNIESGHARGKTGKNFSIVENLLKNESSSPNTIDGLKIVVLQKLFVLSLI